MSSNLVGSTYKTTKIASNEAILILDKKNGGKNGGDTRKRFMPKKKPYTLPTLVRSKSSRTKSGQDWYVEYFFEYPDQPGQFKVFKVRDGINYIHDPAKKEIEALQLLKDVTRALEKENYNPFDDFKETKSQILIAKKRIDEELKLKSGWTLQTAIESYKVEIKESNVKSDTIRTYEAYLRNFEEWLKANNLLTHVAADFTELQLESYLKHKYNLGKWSARTYNNYVSFFYTFFKECERLERKVNRKTIYDCRVNEIRLKKTTAQKNSTYPPKLKEQIKTILNESGNETLRNYIEWIYVSLMRPLEIINLKIINIDQDARQIRIIGKTDDRLIPITDQLMRLINKMGLLKMDINWYVFGEGGVPGPVPIRRDSFSDLYTAKVRIPLKLSNKYGPYSWKPTAMVDMVYAGFSDEEIMQLSGHKTIEAYRAYMRDLVIDKTHVMKGNALEF